MKFRYVYLGLCVTALMIGGSIGAFTAEADHLSAAAPKLPQTTVDDLNAIIVRFNGICSGQAPCKVKRACSVTKQDVSGVLAIIIETPQVLAVSSSFEDEVFSIDVSDLSTLLVQDKKSDDQLVDVAVTPALVKLFAEQIQAARECVEKPLPQSPPIDSATLHRSI